MRNLILILLLGQALQVQGADLWVKVISVESGDLLTVLNTSNKRFTVRLLGVDAPERRQPFFEKSRMHLSKPILGRWVSVRWEKKDAQGRLLGTVKKRKKDYNLIQVQRGFAWLFPTHQKFMAPERAKRLQSAEEVARQTQKGLWAGRKPLAPWKFRRSQNTGPVGRQ